MLNLHHLRVFASVVSERSVSGGAEALLISQPAVSKQIRLLEKSLKTKLLDRHTRGVRATAAGIVLADYATRIFSLANAAEEAVGDLRSLAAGRLNVGAGPTVGVYLLPAAMVRFRLGFPGIRFHAETENADVLRQRLLDERIEFAVTETPMESSAFSSRVLLHDALVPVVAATHSAAKKAAWSAKTFCAEPFIVRETVGGEKSLVERTLAGRGLTVSPVLTVGSTEAMKQAVIAGLGAALISRLAVRTEIAAGLLASPKVAGLAIRYPIHLVRLKGRTPSPSASAFVRLLVETSVV